MRWPTIKGWFVAHKIHKMEPAYVVSVKFVEVARIFATGTTSGEVKLWDNQYCNCLGILNSVDWDPRDLNHHIRHCDQLDQLQEMRTRGYEQARDS